MPAPTADGGDKRASRPSRSDSELRTTAAPWDRPADQARRVQKARLPLHAEEHFDVHFHAQLNVVIDGTPVAVPGALGIETARKGQPSAHGQSGIAPLHTHEADGRLHVESAKEDVFTLGQVFIMWGVLLQEGRIGAYHSGDDKKHQVVVFVNGKKASGDPRNIALTADQKIDVVVTTPAETTVQATA